MPLRGKLDARFDEIEQALSEFDNAGNLGNLEPDQLQGLLVLLEHANTTCQAIVEEHSRREPSQSWFMISVVAGIGGLIVTGPGAIPILISIGGALGAGKSVSDLYSYENESQNNRVLSWSISMRLRKLKIEMIRCDLL